MPYTRHCCVLLTFLLAACAAREEPRQRPLKGPGEGYTIAVFEPGPSAKKTCAPVALDGKTDDDCDAADEVLGWLHIGPPHKKRTLYVPSREAGRYAILAVGRNSASGLVRRVGDVNPYTCPYLEWEWRADAVQKSADLTTKKGDDVAASIGIVFGDPGFWINIKRRPTVRYVWTNGRSVLGEAVKNPHADVVRSIVVRNEPGRVGTWVSERRNILEDYRLAFDSEPKGPVSVVGLFTDNDGTKEPARAYYGSIRFVCGETETARE